MIQLNSPITGKRINYPSHLDTIVCGRISFRRTDAPIGFIFKLTHPSNQSSSRDNTNYSERKNKNANSDYSHEALEDLDQYSHLKQGWDGYTAEPPNYLAIDQAKKFLYCLHEAGIFEYRIAPSVANGIGITIKGSKRKAYIEFYNSGSIFYLLSEENCEPQINPIRASSQSFQKVITDIRTYLEL